MKIYFQYSLFLLLGLTSIYAKVGVCEVQPEATKALYLDCLVKEAERTDETADINMAANGYSTYAMQNEAVYWYEKAIQKGDPKAMYKAAGYYANYVIKSKKINDGYYEGSLLELMKSSLKRSPKELNQPKKAIALYKQAALKNYEDAIAKLSEAMEVVYGKDGAIKQYEKEMAEGDPNTYRFLANLYVRYEEYDKALKLYEAKLKEEPNNAEVYTLIASLYEAHLNDKVKAKDYYEKAAKLGNATAMYNLGIMAGDAEEYEKAEAYFVAAQEAGMKNALGMVCYMYKHKLDDYDAAEECYLKLAESGDASNMNALGYFYRRNMHKYDKAIYWYKKSYDAGYSSAAIGLGAHYSSKYEGEYDKEKATYWYKKAAGMGEPGGWSYLYGEGVFK